MAYIQGNPGEIRELARYEVRPESLAECLSAIHEFVAYVRTNEPGALRYEVWQEAEHPTRFVHLFIWRDAEANRIHGASAAVKKFAGILYPNCLAPVEFTEYGQVDANAVFQGHSRMPDVLQGDSLDAALTVRDLEHSARWYGDVLGFSVDRRHERAGRLIAISLRAGAVRILLAQDDGAKGLDRAKGEGMSLQITTRLDADALAERIKQQGWTLDTEPVTMPHGVRAFRLRDPDGFRLTISSTSVP